MTFEELGQELRQARLAKKWRPRDIVRKTRIQYEYVKNLEAGDFTFMPDPIIRGYIKAYARDVGLNQDEMIKKYNQAKEAKSVEKTPFKKQHEDQIDKKVETKEEKKIDKVKEVEQTKDQQKLSKQNELIPNGLESEKKESKKVDEQKIETEQKVKAKSKFESTEKVEVLPEVQKDKKEKKEKNAVELESESFFQKHRGEIILGVIIFVIVAAMGLVYLKFSTNLFTNEEKPVKKISVFEAQKQNIEKQEIEKPNLEPESIPEKVKIRMSATETTWVLMHIDDIDTTDFMLFPGNIKSFEANSKFYLKIGNAGNLSVWVNDDSLGTLGSGVVEYEITANTVKNLRNSVQPLRAVNRDTSIQ